VFGGAVADQLFEQGLSIPSGSSITSDELARVVRAVRGVFHAP
jgi:dTDP-4-amino-4,6-dideoxygalactose transaminase